MDSLNNYLPSMWKLRELKDKVQNVLYNFTEVEIKVREATNDEAWGPHGTLMQDIAQYTFTYEHYTEVMGMLWKRLFQEKENWRSIYKVGVWGCLFFLAFAIYILIILVVVVA